jgi:hypothetical protein
VFEDVCVIFWILRDLVQKRPHPRGRDVAKTPVGRVLLRLAEFILPPPHPSVKEMDPRGAISYDQREPF